MMCVECGKRKASRIGKKCNNCHRRAVRATQPAIVPRLNREEFCRRYTQVVSANPGLRNYEVANLMGISIYGLGRGLARYRASGHLTIMRASAGTMGAYVVPGWRPREDTDDAA